MSKILVVEDEPLIRQNLIEILELEHYEVFGAEDGRSAIDSLATFMPDLILCDIIMPGVDGYGVLEHVRSQPELASVTFLILSAKSNQEDQQRGLTMGADGYLLKPIRPEYLLEAIASHLQS